MRATLDVVNRICVGVDLVIERVVVLQGNVNDGFEFWSIWVCDCFTSNCYGFRMEDIFILVEKFDVFGNPPVKFEDFLFVFYDRLRGESRRRDSKMRARATVWRVFRI